MNPQGKTALVTGGAHRIGRAITLALATAGANVVVNYNTSASAAAETASEAQALGVGALPIQADVSDHSQVQALVVTALETFRTVDILVNSASLFQKTPFPTSDVDIWHRVTDILIHGGFYCANAVAPLMLEQGAGVIIYIMDMLAQQPRPNFAAHSVGKAALLALTRQLAVDLAPTVRVNAVAPGAVLPPADYSPEQNERIAQRTLLKRWGSPQDVAEAVLYLVRADYVTAEFITVDGGERYGNRA